MKKALIGIAGIAMGVCANADGGASLPKYAPNREITGAHDKTAAAVCANGTFVGERTGDVIAYRGIPYAQQPVGKLRWKAPLEQRLLKNPKYKFVKGLAPVHERIIAQGGAKRFEAVMRKVAELAEETRGAGTKE